MQQISIETAQNVSINYVVAGVADRFMAALFDLFLLYAYVFIIAGLSQLLKLEEVSYWIYGVVMLPCMFYHFLCELFLEGQSFGKRHMNIKVVQLDGGQATLGNYVLRWLFRIVDIAMTFGSLALSTIIINGKGQRLGDMAAGTTVINVQPQTRLSDTLFSEIAADYTPSYSQVVLLNDEQVNAIKDLLNQARQMENNEAVWLLVEKVKSLLGIEAIAHQPRQFLEIIIKDYTYLK